MQHLVLNIGNSNIVENVEFVKEEVSRRISNGTLSLSGYITISTTNISPKFARLYKAIIKNLEDRAGMILRVYFGVENCSLQVLDIVRSAEEFYIPEDMKIVNLPERQQEGAASGMETLMRCIQGENGAKANEISAIRFRDFKPSVGNIRKVNSGFGMDYFFNHELRGLESDDLALIGDLEAFENMKSQAYKEEAEFSYL